MVLSCIEWSGWIIVGRKKKKKERRRPKKKKKKIRQSFFSTCPLAHGRRSGRSTWSVPVQSYIDRQIVRTVAQ